MNKNIVYKISILFLISNSQTKLSIYIVGTSTILENISLITINYLDYSNLIKTIHLDFT